MILELFITLMIIALAFIGLGLYKEEMRAFGIIGSLFLFLLGILVIVPNNLEYKTGSNVTELSATDTVVVYNYVSYNDSTTHYVGYFISIIGFLGVLLVPIVRKVDDE